MIFYIKDFFNDFFHEFPSLFNIIYVINLFVKDCFKNYPKIFSSSETSIIDYFFYNLYISAKKSSYSVEETNLYPSSSTAGKYKGLLASSIFT